MVGKKSAYSGIGLIGFLLLVPLGLFSMTPPLEAVHAQEVEQVTGLIDPPRYDDYRDVEEAKRDWTRTYDVQQDGYRLAVDSSGYLYEIWDNSPEETVTFELLVSPYNQDDPNSYVDRTFQKYHANADGIIIWFYDDDGNVIVGSGYKTMTVEQTGVDPDFFGNVNPIVSEVEMLYSDYHPESESVSLSVTANEEITQNKETGEFTFTTHVPYTWDNNNQTYVPYLLTQDADHIGVEMTDDLHFIFNKNSCTLTIIQEEQILVKDDSYNIRTATIGTDDWSHLAINDESCTTEVKTMGEGVSVIITKQNNEGVLDLNYDMTGGKVKATAVFLNELYPNNKFAFTQSVTLTDPIITLNNEEFDLSQMVGMNVTREQLEQNKDLVIDAMELNYNSGLGFDQLWNVNIAEQNGLPQINLDYANQGEEQIDIGDTLELDPNFEWSDLLSPYDTNPTYSHRVATTTGTGTSYTGFSSYDSYHTARAAHQNDGSAYGVGYITALTYDISRIPDNAVITSVGVVSCTAGYNDADYNSGGVTEYTSRLTVDGSSSPTASDYWNTIGSAVQYYSDLKPGETNWTPGTTGIAHGKQCGYPSWNDVNFMQFNNQATVDLQTRVQSGTDWFGMNWQVLDFPARPYSTCSGNNCFTSETYSQSTQMTATFFVPDDPPTVSTAQTQGGQVDVSWVEGQDTFNNTQFFASDDGNSGACYYNDTFSDQGTSYGCYEEAYYYKEIQGAETVSGVYENGLRFNQGQLNMAGSDIVGIENQSGRFWQMFCGERTGKESCENNDGITIAFWFKPNVTDLGQGVNNWTLSGGAPGQSSPSGAAWRIMCSWESTCSSYSGYKADYWCGRSLMGSYSTSNLYTFGIGYNCDWGYAMSSLHFNGAYTTEDSIDWAGGNWTSPGNWIHFVGTIASDGETSVYLDGVKQDLCTYAQSAGGGKLGDSACVAGASGLTQDMTPAMDAGVKTANQWAGSSGWAIGGVSTHQYDWRGDIDELFIWNTEFTNQNDIHAIANQASSAQQLPMTNRPNWTTPTDTSSALHGNWFPFPQRDKLIRAYTFDGDTENRYIFNEAIKADPSPENYKIYRDGTLIHEQIPNFENLLSHFSYDGTNLDSIGHNRGFTPDNIVAGSSYPGDFEFDPVDKKMGEASLYLGYQDSSGSNKSSSVHVFPASDFEFAYNQPFTVNTWAKSDTSVQYYWGSIVHLGYSWADTYGGWWLAVPYGSAECYLDDSGSATTNSAYHNMGAGDFFDNEWHMISCVYDGAGDMSMYFDGELVTTTTHPSSTKQIGNSSLSSSPTNQDHPLQIGDRGDGGARFAGHIDETMIFDTEFSAQEIADLYLWDKDETVIYDTNVADGVTYTYTATMDSTFDRFNQGQTKVITTALSNGSQITTMGVPDQVPNLTGIDQMIPQIDWGTPASDSPITNYKIYRDASLHDTVGVVNTYQDTTNVVIGSTYVYEVSAVSVIGEGQKSASVSVQAISPPTSPQNLTASITNPQTDPLLVSLTWDEPLDWGSGTVKTYDVLEDVGSTGNFTLVASGLTYVAGQFSTTYTITNSQPLTNYDYKVIAQAHGSSPDSNIAQVTTVNIPDVPTGVTNVIDDPDNNPYEIKVQWNQGADGGTDIKGFRIDRYDSSTLAWTTIVANTGNVATTYIETVPSLVDTQFQYKIASINGIGESALSVESVAVTTPDYPDPPINLVLTLDPDNATTIYVSWDVPLDDGGSAINDFAIYRGTVGNMLPFVNPTGNTDTTYDDNPVSLSTQYCYEITTANAVGWSQKSSNVCVTTHGIPDPPATLTIELDNTSIIDVFENDQVKFATLVWTDSPNYNGGTFSHFTVERNIDGAGWAVAIPSTTSFTATDNGLTAGVDYQYRVTSTSQIGTSLPSGSINGIFSTGTLTLTGGYLAGNTVEMIPEITISEGQPNPTATELKIYNTTTLPNELVFENTFTQALTPTVAHSFGTTYDYPTGEANDSHVYTAWVWTGQDESTTVYESTPLAITVLQPFSNNIYGQEVRDSNYTSSEWTFVAQPANYDLIIRYQHQNPQEDPTFYGYEDIIADVSEGNVSVPNGNGIPVLANANYYISAYLNPTAFDYTINAQNEVTEMRCNENSPNTTICDGETAEMGSNLGAIITPMDVPSGTPSEFVIVSDKDPDATTGQPLGIEGMGDFFGMPMVMLFIIGIASVFTSRTGHMGVVIIGALVGVMFAMGYLTFGDSTTDMAVWGLLIVVIILGVILGKKYV